MVKDTLSSVHSETQAKEDNGAQAHRARESPIQVGAMVGDVDVRSGGISKDIRIDLNRILDAPVHDISHLG